MQFGSTQERQGEALMRFVVMLLEMTGLAAVLRTALPAGVYMLSFRSAALRLFWLAQAATGRRRFKAHELPDWTGPPNILPKQADEYLTAQNVAARVPALYRAWDELEAQCGRLVRWRNTRDREVSLFADTSELIARALAIPPTALAEGAGLCAGPDQFTSDVRSEPFDAPLFHDTS